MDGSGFQATTPSGADCNAQDLSPADTLYCKVQSPYAGQVRSRENLGEVKQR